MDYIENIESVDLSHWYYAHKLKTVMKKVSRHTYQKVYDIGSGVGLFSIFFADVLGKQVFSIDPENKSHKVKSNNESDLSIIQLESHRELKEMEGLVLMMDVLEHVVEDKLFLSEIISRSTPGTLILITVPAFDFLWTEHDVKLQHFRRYTKSRLISLASESSVTIERIEYIYSITLPILLLLKFIRANNLRSMRETSRLENWVMNKLLFFDVSWLPGSSIIMLLKVI
jgi:2-polyprenyl-3-methyl-5-hydroxy-6-metoxy-1,4-benzoquinol methylase